MSRLPEELVVSWPDYHGGLHHRLTITRDKLELYGYSISGMSDEEWEIASQADREEFMADALGALIFDRILNKGAAS